MGQVASLKKDLPAPDRTRLNEYLDDVREIERRIQKAAAACLARSEAARSARGRAGILRRTFQDHVRPAGAGLPAEITRIATMMYARDTSGAVYPQSGVRDGFHVASHHGNNRANMDKYALINKYHVQMLAYFLEKLQATPDGDGNLLDHSMILYGSSMSNGNQHDHDPLPLDPGGRRVRTI